MDEETLETLQASISQFDTALARVDHLAKGYRRQRVITIVLAAVMVLVLALAIVSTVNLVNLRHNADADAARNAAIALDACRARNQTNVVVRTRFDNFYHALDALGTTPSFHQFVADLRAKDEATPIVDRDCDLDGVVSSNDYPADGGP